MTYFKDKTVLVTGGAGFVGSHIVDRLLEEGSKVIVYDNLSTGSKKFLSDVMDKIMFIEGDLLDRNTLNKSLKGIDFVFHMAANADVRNNLNEPLKCLEQNTIATSNLLEAMRANGVRAIAFSSTGSVYGEAEVFPTPENAPFPVQTSLYGASKLSCEGLLQAYAEGYDFGVYIFRFVSLMGERYSHGCVYDFSEKLLKDSNKLLILGDGKQRKSYLYVKDCVRAMITVIEKYDSGLNIYNLGHDEYIDVTPIAKLVCEELGLKDVNFKYSGGKRGWIGDSPFIHLDITKIKKLGWKPTLSVEDCVRKTTNWIKENKWVFERSN